MVFTPDELMRADKNECFIIFQRMNMMKCHKFPVTLHPDYDRMEAHPVLPQDVIPSIDDEEARKEYEAKLIRDADEYQTWIEAGNVEHHGRGEEAPPRRNAYDIDPEEDGLIAIIAKKAMKHSIEKSSVRMQTSQDMGVEGSDFEYEIDFDATLKAKETERSAASRYMRPLPDIGESSYAQDAESPGSDEYQTSSKKPARKSSEEARHVRTNEEATVILSGSDDSDFFDEDSESENPSPSLKTYSQVTNGKQQNIKRPTKRQTPSGERVIGEKSVASDGKKIAQRKAQSPTRNQTASVADSGRKVEPGEKMVSGAIPRQSAASILDAMNKKSKSRSAGSDNRANASASKSGQKKSDSPASSPKNSAASQKTSASGQKLGKTKLDHESVVKGSKQNSTKHKDVIIEAPELSNPGKKSLPKSVEFKDSESPAKIISSESPDEPTVVLPESDKPFALGAFIERQTTKRDAAKKSHHGIKEEMIDDVDASVVEIFDADADTSPDAEFFDD
jgi:hypothetical protein